MRMAENKVSALYFVCKNPCSTAFGRSPPQVCLHVPGKPPTCATAQIPLLSSVPLWTWRSAAERVLAAAAEPTMRT